MLGRSARLACDACFTAIIDLAICWVCGGIVWRESDCVSLGWCFWHKACYGCLFCGNRAVVRGPSIADLFRPDNDDDDGDDSDGDGVEAEDENGKLTRTGHRWAGRTKKALEVDEVPLCRQCLAEMERGGHLPDAEAMVQRAIGTTERSDGGLSRMRWEARSASVDPAAEKTQRQRPGERQAAVVCAPFFLCLSLGCATAPY